MDTKSFLEEILPSEGYIVLAEFKQNTSYPVHHFYTDVETAAEEAHALDAKGSDVYHACATYATNENRKQSNVQFVKCFWLDIDVGKADSYQTQKDAVAELGAVCGTLGLKLPTIISSGRGLHCYWVFNDYIPVDVWKANVVKFRTALDALGFKHDPARTTDQASILRPVGTTWRKNGERPVRLVRQGVRTDFADVMAGIEKYLGESRIAAPRPLFQVESLGAKIEYPPSSAVIIAGSCAQIARMRDMKGAISEPEWRNCIGILKHTVEGNILCHDWSKGDTRYDETETQRKIDGWNAAPTTCAKMAETNPHLCSGCKFKDKVTSPIQLGYTAVESAPTLEQPKEVSVEAVDYGHYWPKNFRWDETSNRLSRLVKGEDGIPDWDPFCDTLFFPTARVQMEDGTWALKYSMQVTKGKWRQFEIPTKVLASAESFSSALASYEVIIYNRKGVHAMSYVHEWLEKFKQSGVEINTFKNYGWHDDYQSFLLGDRLLQKDGTETTIQRASNITPGSRIHTDFTNFTAQGTAAEWSGIFNEIYNRRDVEHFQFVALGLMVAPLVALFEVDGWNGIPMALTGEGANGKTSLGRAACSIYGKGESFVFDTKNSTMNAFDPFVAGLNNMPCVFDELTGRDPKQVSDKLYAISNGGGRDRADQKGNMSGVRHKWKTISLITGNTNITESMHQLEKNQADASAVRVFEIIITNQNGAKLFEGVNVPELLNRLQDYYGAVGRELTKASMHERVKLREAFLKARARLGYESATYEPRERFFIDLIATVDVGGKVLKALGYIHFDLIRIRDWAMSQIMEMRLMRSETTYTADDQLAAFFGSLNGHLLYTKDISRTHIENPIDTYRLFGDIKGRVAIGKGSERVIISSRALDEWCVKSGIAPRVFRKQLREKGYFKADAPEKFTLTLGTNLPSAQERILEFIPEKVINVAIPDQQQGNVVKLR